MGGHVIYTETQRQYDRGIAEGSEKRLITSICKKMKKGKNPEVIAEELEEEDFSLVCKIYGIAKGFAPDYAVEAIYNKLHAE